MPIPLRSDFDAAQVRRAARESKDANQVRRLLALAAIYEGATRTGQQQRSKASDSPADSERLSATAELSVHLRSGAVRAAAARDACDARRLDPFSQLR